MNGEEQVIENAHTREKRGRLKSPCHAEMSAFIDGQVGDITAPEVDVAGIGGMLTVEYV